MKKEEVKTKSFASGLNFYKLFWIFFIGCFVGVIIEEIWCFITRFTLESRSGLIYGPFNLVYGFGAVFITIGLQWLKDKNDSYIFWGGFLIGSIFEYFCSYFQEIMFGTVSWEYSKMPLNLNGRINFVYSIFWGILSLVWIRWLYPKLVSWIERIPNQVGVSLTWVLVVFMIFNVTISALAVNRKNERYYDIPANTAFDHFLDRNYPDEMLEKIYPNAQRIE